MAPVVDKSSSLIFESVSISGVKAKALIDTGATTSCCRWDWYNRWKSRLGSLDRTDTVVIGVGNNPINVKGVTRPVLIKWGVAQVKCQFMVLTTLQGMDVLLGMDALRQLDVGIEMRSGLARPKQEPKGPSIMTLSTRVKIPVGKTRIFFL